MFCNQPRHRSLFLAFMGCWVLFVPIASADGPMGRDAGKADVAFREALSLLKQNDWSRACVLFERSQELDPSPSTLLKLARCRQHEDRFAQAWQLVRKARELNREQNKDNASRRDTLETYAKAFEDELEPKLGKIRLMISGESADNVTILVDGMAETTMHAGEPHWLEAGEHTISWSGQGIRSANIEVHVIAREAQDVQIVLEPASKAEQAPASSAESSLLSGTAIPSTTPTSPPHRRDLGPRRVTGFAVLGASTVALGIAGYFAVRTISKVDASSPYCNASNRCVLEGYTLRQQASTSQTAALISLAVGAALGGTGLFLTLGRSPNERGVEHGQETYRGRQGTRATLIGWSGEW